MSYGNDYGNNNNYNNNRGGNSGGYRGGNSGGRRFDNNNNRDRFERSPPVKEGEEVDVRIEAVGEKGDGVAKKDGFVLFVPNVNAGDEVRIKITKVLRKVGFAEVLGPAQGPVAESSSPAPQQKSRSAAEEKAAELTHVANAAESMEDSEDFGDEDDEPVKEESMAPEDPADSNEPAHVDETEADSDEPVEEVSADDSVDESLPVEDDESTPAKEADDSENMVPLGLDEEEKPKTE